MEIKRTITSIFMIPTLKIPKDSLKNNGFINGYVKDEMRDVQYKDAIYLLFRPEQIDRFREFLDEEYERTKDIIDDYDYADGFVVIVYKLNEKYSNDFTLIMNGKYSKTSKEFQREFPKKVKIEKGAIVKEDLSLQYRIFNRTEDLIKFWEDKFDVEFDDEQEIWEGFDIVSETLTQDTLINYKIK